MKTIISFFLTGKKKFLAVLVLIILGILIYQFKPFGLFAKGLDTDLKLEKVERSDLTTTITASGTVEASSSAAMGFLTSGRVAYVGFREGDQVKKGQVIASLDLTEKKESVSKYEANLKYYQSALDLVLDDTRLWQYGNQNTKDETQTQKTNREKAEMLRDEAYRDLQTAKKQLEWSSIIAPFDGKITKLEAITAGQNVTALSAGSVTIEGQAVKFVANVDEIDFAYLKEGMKGEIVLDAYPDEKISGEIFKIKDSAVKLATGGSVVPVELTISPSQKVIGNLNGEVTFTVTDKQNVLKIPKSALREEENKTFVYIFQKNKIQKRQIETGKALGSQVEVTSGLSENEQVVIGEVKP